MVSGADARSGKAVRLDVLSGTIQFVQWLQVLGCGTGCAACFRSLLLGPQPSSQSGARRAARLC